MPHYLLSVHGPAERDDYGNYGSAEEMEAAFADTGAFNDRIRRDGHLVFAGGLLEASTAVVVDGTSEVPAQTQGPYLRGPEALGGFWVIEAPDMQTAVQLAADGSRACRGAVEVRPFEGLA